MIRRWCRRSSSICLGLWDRFCLAALFLPAAARRAFLSRMSGCGRAGQGLGSQARLACGKIPLATRALKGARQCRRAAFWTGEVWPLSGRSSDSEPSIQAPAHPCRSAHLLVEGVACLGPFEGLDSFGAVRTLRIVESLACSADAARARRGGAVVRWSGARGTLPCHPARSRRTCSRADSKSAAFRVYAGSRLRGVCLRGVVYVGSGLAFRASFGVRSCLLPTFLRGKAPRGAFDLACPSPA